MDRVSFLRSLPYLRQIHPDVWRACCQEKSTSSGSSASPPTPIGESDSNMVLLDEIFAVSIEPNDELTPRRKRSRAGDHYPKTKGHPAFFSNLKDNAVDILNRPKNGDEDAPNARNHQTNNDPTMCTFEVAIVKKRQILTSSFLRSGICKDSTFNTPSTRTDHTNHTYHEEDSTLVLFRFGNHFVFEVNATHISKLCYRSGYKEIAENRDDGDGATAVQQALMEAECQTNGSNLNLFKNQKNECITTISKSMHPPCLCIEFGGEFTRMPSCTFRVFPMNSLPSRESNTTSGIETSLRKFQSIISRTFNIGDCEVSPFISPPFETIHSGFWPACLDPNLHNVSLAKTDSNSSNFEHGQNDSMQLKSVAIECNDSDKSNDIKSGKNDKTEKESEQMDSLGDDASVRRPHNQHEIPVPNHETDIMGTISLKRRLFDSNWSMIRELTSEKLVTSLLTPCADSLSGCYLDQKQHVIFADQCDSDIQAATNNVEMMLKSMIPARGKSAHDNLGGDPLAEGAHIYDKLEDLLQLRKQAVAAKYSLLLIPKK